jgi:EmrB/QacA subfamily drug resistance transporter
LTVRVERLVLLTVTLGIVLAPLNSTMIAVALPQVMDSFEVGIAIAGWLVMGYLIGMASLQPLAGKLGDRFGHRRMILMGLSAFGVVSAAAALAPTIWLLLTFRIFQAISAALIVPSGSGVLREILPEHRRGAGFGLMGAGIAIAAALGPPLGGFLVEAAGWRAIFYINLLLVAPALAIGLRYLPTMKTSTTRPNFDWVGAVLLPLLLVLTTWILIAFSKGDSAWYVAVGVPLVVMLATTLGWYESRHADPVVQLGFFRRRAFAASAAGIAFGNLAMYSLLVSIPLLLASRNDSSVRIGLVLTAMSAGMTISSYLGGRLIDKYGRRLPTTVGLTMLTGGVIPITMLGPGITLPALLVGLGLVGAGLGLATPGLQTSAVESVERFHTGSASGLYSTSRYLGSIVGSAIIAGILGADKSGVDGLGLVFLICLVASALATLASLGLPHLNPETVRDEGR